MAEQTIHPSPEELNAFSLGQLRSDAAAAVESHISECRPCCETLLGLSTDDTFVELLQEAKQPPTDQTVAQDRAQLGGPSTPVVPQPLAEHPRYEILELIGKGGMGDVYRARHRMMDRTVALKIINRELVRKPEAVDRFHREVKTAASLSHSNIVTAHDAEQAGDVHFLVMEFVDGVDLARTIKEHGPLPIGKACDCIRQAARGLQYAHERGMVHRDIKPHNLMVTADGTVKILDFGLATLSPEALVGADTTSANSDLTAVGSIMGTPDFIAPEQAADAHQADVRSDIYSLGATFYYLLSGQTPFAEGSVMHKLRSHAEVEPEPIESVQVDVPAELAGIIRRMMAKNPAERFQTPADVADTLAPLVDRHRIVLSTKAPKPRAEPMSQPPRIWISLALGALALALVLAGVIYVVTDTGTLVIESVDDSIEIAVRPLDHESREGNKHGKAIHFRVGDSATGSTIKRLRSGVYIVDLKGRENEYEASQDRFILKRGGKIIVTVTRRDDTAIPPAEAAPVVENDALSASGLTEIARYEGLGAYALHLDVSPNGRWMVSASGMPECNGVVWELSTGRLLSRYDEHHSTIYRVAFSPDSQLVAMAHWDGAVSLFDPRTGEQRGELDEHDGRLEYLAFSPDGKYLATGTTSYSDAHSRGNNADVSFRIFDVATQKLAHQHNFVTSEARHGGIWELQFSPDSKRLLVAVELYPNAKIDSRNVGFVDEFDVGTWKRSRRLCSAPEDGSKVRSLRYSPDGRWIATGHQATGITNERWWDDPQNGVIRIWDAKAFKLHRTLRGHRGGIRSIDFSPDSRLLASGNGYQWDKGVAIEAIQYTIRVWDVAAGKEIAQTELEETIQCVRFTTDGQSVISGSGGLGQRPLIQRWRLPGSRSATTVARAPAKLLDGPRLDGNASISGFRGYVINCEFSHDGKLLVAGSGNPDCRGMVWEMQTGQPINKYEGHHSTVFRVAFSPDDSTVAMAHWNGVVTFWDPLTGNEVDRIEGHIGRLQHLAYTPDGKYLITATTSNGDTDDRSSTGDISLYVWDAATKEMIRRIPLTLGVGTFGEIEWLSVSPDGRQLLVTADLHLGDQVTQFVRRYEIGSWKSLGELFQPQDNESAAISLTYSPDGRWIATGHRAKRLIERRRFDDPDRCVVRLWDVQSGKLVRTLHGHRGSVRSLHFAPDSKTLASVSGYDFINGEGVEGTDYTIRLWDVATGVEMARQPLPKTGQCVRFHPDGTYLVSACGGVGQGTEMKIWKLPQVNDSRP